MPITPLTLTAVADTRRENKVHDFRKLSLAIAKVMLIKVKSACLLKEAS